jgi:hypothetical protein
MLFCDRQTTGSGPVDRDRVELQCCWAPMRSPAEYRPSRTTALLKAKSHGRVPALDSCADGVVGGGGDDMDVGGILDSAHVLHPLGLKARFAGIGLRQGKTNRHRMIQAPAIFFSVGLVAARSVRTDAQRRESPLPERSALPKAGLRSPFRGERDRQSRKRDYWSVWAAPPA